MLKIYSYLTYLPPTLTAPQKLIYLIFKFMPLFLMSSFLITTLSTPTSPPIPVPFSTFLSHLSANAITSGVGISNRGNSLLSTVHYKTPSGRHVTQVPLGATGEMYKKLISKGTTFGALPPTSGEKLARKGTLLIPVLYMALVYRIYKRMTSGGAQGGTTGEVIGGSSIPNVTFDDVVGMDRERREVIEILDSMLDEGKYNRMGARTPKGVLMEGPPGTGKTLLAKALAGSGRVPMITVSGSDFMEVFVGRGASRVRELFKKAGKMGRCVIFIDEIDAVGKKRGIGFGGRGNDEQEQTLNALLAAMDGVKGNEGVVVLAATNRAEILDDALTRPGRFDRIVKVTLPDREGRGGIFQLHGSRLGGWGKGNVDVGRLADLTGGFSGAEIEGCCNEAAIRAVRRGGAGVRIEDFELAIKDFRVSRNKIGMFGM